MSGTPAGAASAWDFNLHYTPNTVAAFAKTASERFGYAGIAMNFEVEDLAEMEELLCILKEKSLEEETRATAPAPAGSTTSRPMGKTTSMLLSSSTLSSCSTTLKKNNYNIHATTGGAGAKATGKAKSQFRARFVQFVEECDLESSRFLEEQRSRVLMKSRHEGQDGERQKVARPREMKQLQATTSTASYNRFVDKKSGSNDGSKMKIKTPPAAPPADVLKRVTLVHDGAAVNFHRKTDLIREIATLLRRRASSQRNGKNIETATISSAFRGGQEQEQSTPLAEHFPSDGQQPDSNGQTKAESSTSLIRKQGQLHHSSRLLPATKRAKKQELEVVQAANRSTENNKSPLHDDHRVENGRSFTTKPWLLHKNYANAQRHPWCDFLVAIRPGSDQALTEIANLGGGGTTSAIGSLSSLPGGSTSANAPPLFDLLALPLEQPATSATGIRILRPQVTALLDRNPALLFEVPFAHCLRAEQADQFRHFFQNLQKLARLTHGKHCLLTSGARAPAEQRSKFDLVNLAYVSGVLQVQHAERHLQQGCRNFGLLSCSYGDAANLNGGGGPAGRGNRTHVSVANHSTTCANFYAPAPVGVVRC